CAGCHAFRAAVRACAGSKRERRLERGNVPVRRGAAVLAWTTTRRAVHGRTGCGAATSGGAPFVGVPGSARRSAAARSTRGGGGRAVGTGGQGSLPRADGGAAD